MPWRRRLPDWSRCGASIATSTGTRSADLFGVDYNAHAEFPNDESGYGFDNIGDVLSLPPMLLEKYLAAAETIAGRSLKPKIPRANESND